MFVISLFTHAKIAPVGAEFIWEKYVTLRIHSILRSNDS